MGRDQEGIAVQAGDYVTVTYDGAKRRRVYFPAIHGDTVGLYIAHDGSTYWDRGLCNLAQAALSPTPTPTPLPRAQVLLNGTSIARGVRSRRHSD